MAAVKTQTVLVVEDHENVRDLVRRIVVKGGYHTLIASSGAEAMHVQSDFTGEIHLLLSDVMMPDLSGPDLAKKLKVIRPSMRVMLMSGYPDGALLVLNYGWHFIHKPFLPAVLLGKIKDVLSGDSREQETDHFDTRK